MKQLAFDFFNALMPKAPERERGSAQKKQPRLPKAPPAVEKREAFTLTPPFSYRLERAKRKTVGFIVDERGLTVRAPRWVSVAEIEKMISEREGWIQKKLAQFADWQKELGTQSVHFVHGAEIPYLGRPMRLYLDPSATAVFQDKTKEGLRLVINLPLDSDERRVKDWDQVWFKKEAERYLGSRLRAIADRALLSYSGWGLSSAKGRWGSCSSDRKIRLNWRLIHLDPDIVDYVIAHELAHLDEMNHGPKFWQRVAEIDPGYESARQKLKGIYIPTLPF